MQTKGILGVVLAFGVMFALLAGSGIGTAIFGVDSSEADSSRVIDEIAGDADVSPENEDGGLGADVSGDNEPTVVGVVVRGGQFVAQLVAAVALVPWTLMRLGFPAYFAVPVGGVAQILAFIGLAQFITGREYL